MSAAPKKRYLMLASDLVSTDDDGRKEVGDDQDPYGRGRLPAKLASVDPNAPAIVAASQRERFWPIGIMTTAVTAIALVPVFRLWDASLRVPFNYSGDANSAAVIVKGVLDHGWYATNRNLGAPFVQHLSDYPFSGNLHMVLMRVLGFSGASYPVVINLYFLLGYALVAVAAAWVLRRLGVSTAVAVAISVLYSFLPFHQTRGEAHLFLGAYFIVPLACYLILRSLEPRPLLRGQTLLTRTNVGVIAICVLIGCANEYYAVFTLLLLALVLAVQAFRRASVMQLASTVVMAAVIAVTLGLNMAPNLLYERNHGTNTAIEHRDVSDSERYGLKLTSVLLPREQHRVDLLARITAKYSKNTPVDSEQGQSFGLIGAGGLLLLLGLAVLGPSGRRLPRPLDDRLRQLSALTVGVILLATIGGFSSLIAFVVPQVRGWNRISVFLAFFVFYGVALVLDHARQSRVIPDVVKKAAPVLLASAGRIWRRRPNQKPSALRAYEDRVRERRQVRTLNRAAPRQHRDGVPAPLQPVPGICPARRYGVLRPGARYLHSSTLRWSWGAMRGRPQGDWQDALVAGTVRDMLDTVAAVGFTGIYIDRFGYADRGAEIERQIGALAPGPSLDSPNHRLVLYDIRAYATALRETDPERFAALRASILNLGLRTP